MLIYGMIRQGSIRMNEETHKYTETINLIWLILDLFVNFLTGFFLLVIDVYNPGWRVTWQVFIAGWSVTVVWGVWGVVHVFRRVKEAAEVHVAASLSAWSASPSHLITATLLLLFLFTALAVIVFFFADVHWLYTYGWVARSAVEPWEVTKLRQHRLLLYLNQQVSILFKPIVIFADIAYLWTKFLPF